jgi:ketosteroid isomerase-like protein
MSRENVEVVRRIYAFLNEGDVSGVIALCEPDFRMDMTERVFNPDTYEGPDGLRRFHEEVREAWASYRWEVEDAHPVGNRVIAMLHCEGHGHGGGPPADWRVAWVWTFRAGRPVAVRFYRERSEALEAVGLRE